MISSKRDDNKGSYRKVSNRQSKKLDDSFDHIQNGKNSKTKNYN